MKHHTKEKGDLGLVKIIADLTQKGYDILVPLSEHLPFDFVAYKDGKLYKVQAKARHIYRGVLDVHFRSTWADKNGCHNKKTDKSGADFYGLYCLDNDTCYYFNHNLYGQYFSIRINETANNQTKNVHLGKDFLQVPEI